MKLFNCLASLLLCLFVYTANGQQGEMLSEREASATFTKVEQMPEYPGCEEETDDQLRSKCAQKKMFEFIAENLKYPKQAQVNKTEGTVVISFIVDKQGKIIDPKITKGIGDGCEEEAIRVITEMPDWTPGMEKGNKVAVHYNLPFRFRL